MPIDDRLRSGLARNAEHVDPSVERHLATVLTRTRRHTLVLRAAAVTGIAAAAAVTVSVGPDLVEALRADVDVVAPAESTASPAVTGIFATMIASDTPGIGTSGVDGRWTIQFESDGTLAVDGPDSYGGILSAALFEATPGQLRTDVFGQDLCSAGGVGTYEWTRSGSTLTFRVLDDACEERVAVFTSVPWQQIP